LLPLLKEFLSTHREALAADGFYDTVRERDRPVTQFQKDMQLVILNKEAWIYGIVPRAMTGPQLRQRVSSILGLSPDLFTLMGIMEITNLKFTSHGVKDGDRISVVLKANSTGQAIMLRTGKLSALLLQYLVQSIH
jgi:hypothetical protein